jgi:hypothetical protein
MDDPRHTDGVAGDDVYDMFRHDRLDQRTVDAVLDGRGTDAPDDEVADLVAFSAALREARAANPRPTPELVDALTAGIPAPQGHDLAHAVASDANPSVPSPRRRPMFEALTAKLAALGLAAKIGLGSTVVLAATTGAAALDGLPQPAQDAVANAVATVSPISLPSSASDNAEAASAFGHSVAEDATDPDSPGVDGCEIAARALEEKSQASEEAREAVEEDCGSEEGGFDPASTDTPGANGRATAEERRNADIETSEGVDGEDGPEIELPDIVPDEIPPVTPPNGQ